MTALGIGGMRPHDRRHTGNTPSARTGANTKELMDRFGRSSYPVQATPGSPVG
jgi:hypothetical protein